MDKITITTADDNLTHNFSVKDLTKVSDGYHTIEELYDHRSLLYITLANEVAHKYNVSYKLDDYPGWFVLYIELPTGQISYHIREKYFDLVCENPNIARQLSTSHWDGHTSKNVIERLIEYSKIGKIKKWFNL